MDDKRHGDVFAPDDARSDYEVGYGKPPKHGQFKKGERRNPNGRPKGASAAKKLRKLLNEKIALREDGRLRNISKMDVGLTNLVNKFAKTGDPKLLKAINDLDPELVRGPTAEALQHLVEDCARANTSEVLDWYRGRIIDQYRESQTPPSTEGGSDDDVV